MWLLILLIIICVVLLIVKYKSINYNYWKKKNVLQIDNLIWTFLFDGRSMPEICKTIYDKYDTPHIGTFMGTTPTLIVKDIKDIKSILADNFESFHSHGIETNPCDILADNLLFMGEYQKWKLMRHRMTPILSEYNLQNMFYIIEKCARDFVELVEDNRHLRQKPFNVLYTYSTATIGATVFGIDPQSKNSTMYSPFLDMAWKYVNPSLKTSVQVFIANVFPSLFKLLNLKMFGEHEKFFVGVVKSVLKYRRTYIQRRYDVIERCVELQRHGIMHDFTTGYDLRPTDELLAAQFFSFFIAGADTTANAMHYTLLEISNNPQILIKLHKEIDKVFGVYREELTFNDIEKLPYLDLVVSEALRKYPPIGFIRRMCTQNTVLPSKLKIEKGTIIAIPILAIHRDEKYYPNPDLFDPERFCTKNMNDIKPFTYLPFGEGHRICIGMEFARLQIKTALAWLLRRFTLAGQNYKPKFEKNTFALRDPEALYTLIVRDLPVE